MEPALEPLVLTLETPRSVRVLLDEEHNDLTVGDLWTGALRPADDAPGFLAFRDTERIDRIAEIRPRFGRDEPGRKELEGRIRDWLAREWPTLPRSLIDALEPLRECCDWILANHLPRGNDAPEQPQSVEDPLRPVLKRRPGHVADLIIFPPAGGNFDGSVTELPRQGRSKFARPFILLMRTSGTVTTDITAHLKLATAVLVPVGAAYAFPVVGGSAIRSSRSLLAAEVVLPDALLDLASVPPCGTRPDHPLRPAPRDLALLRPRGADENRERVRKLEADAERIAREVAFLTAEAAAMDRGMTRSVVAVTGLGRDQMMAARPYGVILRHVYLEPGATTMSLEGDDALTLRGLLELHADEPGVEVRLVRAYAYDDMGRGEDDDWRWMFAGSPHPALPPEGMRTHALVRNLTAVYYGHEDRPGRVVRRDPPLIAYEEPPPRQGWDAGRKPHEPPRRVQERGRSRDRRRDRSSTSRSRDRGCSEESGISFEAPHHDSELIALSMLIVA